MSDTICELCGATYPSDLKICPACHGINATPESRANAAKEILKRDARKALKLLWEPDPDLDPDGAHRYDRNNAHVEADGILCNLLKELGFDDVVEAYDKIEKWYS